MFFYSVKLKTTSTGVDITDTLNITGITTVKTELNATGTGDPIVKICNTRLNTGSGAAGLRFITNEITGTEQYTRAQISAEYDGASNVSGRLIFSTTNSSGTLTARARIDDDGNLGINDSSPDCKLSIESGSAGDNHKIADFRGSTVGNAASLQIRYYAVGSDDNRTGLYWEHQNVGNMRMWMGDDSKLRMSNATPGSANAGNAFVQEGIAAGNIKMSSGSGIDFSSTGDGTSMTSEVLDDYEEGTFSFNEANISVSNYEARYTKIGRVVMCSARIIFGSSSNTNTLNLTGLPFTPDSGAGNSTCGGVIPEQNLGLGAIFMAVEHGNNTVRIRKDNGAVCTPANMSGKGIRFVLWYIAT